MSYWLPLEHFHIKHSAPTGGCAWPGSPRRFSWDINRLWNCWQVAQNNRSNVGSRPTNCCLFYLFHHGKCDTIHCPLLLHRHFSCVLYYINQKQVTSSCQKFTLSITTSVYGFAVCFSLPESLRFFRHDNTDVLNNIVPLFTFYVQCLYTQFAD